MLQKPQAPAENAPYYFGYIDQVDEEQMMVALEKGRDLLDAFYREMPEEKLEYRYEEGKWTPKEVLIHIMDTERIFAYRALRFGRGDETALPGFDQNIYVPPALANERSLGSLLDEYQAVREATISLFDSFTDEDLMREGMASDLPVSPLRLGYVIAGHEYHHIRILKERYL